LNQIAWFDVVFNRGNFMNARSILNWLACCTLINVQGGANAWAGNLNEKSALPSPQDTAPAGGDFSFDSVPLPLQPVDHDGHDKQVDNAHNNAQLPNTTGLPIKYWGNSFSGKFHRPSCPFAQVMSLRHVIFFNFRRQAVESGQTPCRYCLPPFWTSVKSKILPPEPQKCSESIKFVETGN
jgi:hypothetical protein